MGLEVDVRGGKGSHCLVKNPHTSQKYTIQVKLHKFINIKIFQKLLEWGFDEDEINKALK